MHNYLIFKSKYLIKNDLRSFALCLNHFIDFPIFFSAGILNGLMVAFLKSFYPIAFVLARFFLPKRSLKEKFLIRRKGGGNWGSEVDLTVKNGLLSITKRYLLKQNADNEERFLNQYKNKTGRIILPEYKRIGEREIAYEFINQKNLWQELQEGIVDKNNYEEIFRQIREGLEDFYMHQKECLIHGDLFPVNLYRSSDKKSFCLIDYGDSHWYNTKYDQYILFKAMIDILNLENESKILGKFFTGTEIAKFCKHKNEINRKKYNAKAKAKT